MKVAILGGGPGGYVCAIKAAQLGASVVIIEKEHIGGTCLNTGCIPTKALLHATGLYRLMKEESKELGLEIDDVNLNWNTIQNRKQLAATQLVEGVKTLLETNNIKIIEGTGKFISNKEIQIIKKNKEREIIRFDKAVIATGSYPAKVPIPGIDLEGVITSEEALSLEEVPQNLCIIGGGVIGVEFANIYSNVGAKVTIVEMLPHIIANMDRDIVNCLEEELNNTGIQIYKSTIVEKIEKQGDKLKVSISSDEGIKDIITDRVLLSIGRKPNIDSIGLDNIGVKIEKGAILVDKSMKTSVDNIYAIGDCTGGALLAHVASAQGVKAAENIMGGFIDMDFKTTPYCIYTKPELAGVGLTEKEALDKGYSIKTGHFPLYANGKAITMGDVNGLIKYVVDKNTDEILGLHIAGPNATELIAVGALVIRLEATLEEIITTIHAHPTVAEALNEGALAVDSRAIHLPKI